MTLKNPAAHMEGLLSNLGEVVQLMKIHEAQTGSGPGRRHNVEILNKSAIVLVVACWEAFIEDLVRVGLGFMLSSGKDHTLFPRALLERVGHKYSGPHAWKLAGEGWKAVMRDNLSELLAKTTGTLNTPRTAQVDELLLKTLGHPKLSLAWHWKGRNVRQACEALDSLVLLRGAIAHRVKHSESVRKTQVFDAIDLVSRLSVRSNNELGAFLRERAGTAPWRGVSYKGLV